MNSILENKATVVTQWDTTIDVRKGKIADDSTAIHLAFWWNLTNFPAQENIVIRVTIGQMSTTASNLPKITGGRYEQLLRQIFIPSHIFLQIVFKIHF